MIFCVKVVCCIILYFLQNLNFAFFHKQKNILFKSNNKSLSYKLNATIQKLPLLLLLFIIVYKLCTIFIIKQLMTELHLLARRKKKNFNIDNSIPVLRIFNFLLFFFTFCLYYKKQLKVVDNACVSFSVLLTRRRKNELNSQGKTQTLQNCSGIKLKRKE